MSQNHSQMQGQEGLIHEIGLEPSSQIIQEAQIEEQKMRGNEEEAKVQEGYQSESEKEEDWQQENFQNIPPHRNGFTTEEEILDEQTAKRLLLKHAKSGNVESFKSTLEKSGPLKLQTRCNFNYCIKTKILDFHKHDVEIKYIIHHVLFNANYELLEFLMNYFGENQEDLNFVPFEQNPPTHLALALAGISKYRERCIKCVKLLLESEYLTSIIDINAQDRLGRTIFHLSCMHGLDDLLSYLISRGVSHNQYDIDGNYPVDYAIDFQQENCINMLTDCFGSELLAIEDNILVRAIRKGSWGCFASILQVTGLDFLSIKGDGKLPQEAAIEYGVIEEYDAIVNAMKEEKDITNVQELIKPIIEKKDQKKKSLIITDEKLIEHAGFENYNNVTQRKRHKDDQPENAERIMVLINKERGVLSAMDEFVNNEQLIFKKGTNSAKLSDVFRVHDYNYLMKIRDLCENTLKDTKNQVRARYDRDTVVSQKSWECMFLSSGAVIEAVDKIMKGEATRAFCAIRPPGHHAGVYGATLEKTKDVCDHSMTQGFCFINNLAVAASYLKNMYRNQIKKIAIVDFDVHHGNGTQEIIECLRPRKFQMKSILPFSALKVTQYQYRPWLDESDPQNVLFCSTHLYDGDENGFYPGTGGLDNNTQIDDEIYPGGILNVPLVAGTVNSGKWRKSYQEIVFPRLIEFKPDFIFISAGFDAHERDHLHSFGDTRVTEFEYQWLTENLVKIANQFAQGRIVSVFEGGYNTNAGTISPLAQSVQFHVRALTQPNNAIYGYPTEEQLQLEKTKRSILKKRRAEFMSYDRMQLRKRRRVEQIQEIIEQEKDDQNNTQINRIIESQTFQEDVVEILPDNYNNIISLDNYLEAMQQDDIQIIQDQQQQQQQEMIDVDNQAYDIDIDEKDEEQNMQ